MSFSRSSASVSSNTSYNLDSTQLGEAVDEKVGEDSAYHPIDGPNWQDMRLLGQSQLGGFARPATPDLFHSNCH